VLVADVNLTALALDRELDGLGSRLLGAL